MAKTKKQETVTELTPEIDAELAEIERQEQELRERKKLVKNKTHIADARKTLAELESKYDEAKRIFFAVNGARRIIENSNKSE